mmetsp:Transcript_16466/g.52122  ORF Transcript_16466/g.52122 Transcript_16466/m.52122 type:complete len:350 (+) Transcript_16466:154-1203(+)
MARDFKSARRGPPTPAPRLVWSRVGPASTGLPSCLAGGGLRLGDRAGEPSLSRRAPRQLRLRLDEPAPRLPRGREVSALGRGRRVVPPAVDEVLAPPRTHPSAASVAFVRERRPQDRCGALLRRAEEAARGARGLEQAAEGRAELPAQHRRPDDPWVAVPHDRAPARGARGAQEQRHVHQPKLALRVSTQAAVDGRVGCGQADARRPQVARRPHVDHASLGTEAGPEGDRQRGGRAEVDSQRRPDRPAHAAGIVDEQPHAPAAQRPSEPLRRPPLLQVQVHVKRTAAALADGCRQRLPTPPVARGAAYLKAPLSEATADLLSDATSSAGDHSEATLEWRDWRRRSAARE